MPCQIRHEEVREKNREAMPLRGGNARKGADIAVTSRRRIRGRADLGSDSGSGFGEVMLRSRSPVDLSIAIDDNSSPPCERHPSSFIPRATACPARKTFASRMRTRQRVASDSVHVLVQCTRAKTLELPLQRTISCCRNGYRHDDGPTTPVVVALGSSEVMAAGARRAFGPWKESFW
jgi:hypothetical protein